MTANFANSKLYKRLKDYNGWQKWLDTKNVDINSADGSVTWSFSLIMTKGGCNPIAFVDINTTDTTDAKTKRITKSIQGTIDGLSKSETGSFLKNGVCETQRLDNANEVWEAIKGGVVAGTWPGTPAPAGDIPEPPEGSPEPPKPECEPKPAPSCYQRISSSATISRVAGRITFNAEFGDIDSCKPGGDTSLSFTVEEKLPAANVVETIIPGEQRSIIQVIGMSQHTVSVTVVGTLSGCDPSKIMEVTNCVNAEFEKRIDPYSGWLLISRSDTTTSKTYTRTRLFMECDS